MRNGGQRKQADPGHRTAALIPQGAARMWGTAPVVLQVWVFGTNGDTCKRGKEESVLECAGVYECVTVCEHVCVCD